jgi:hypothetical protein
MTTISVRDPLGASRKNELIRFAVPGNRPEALWWARDAQGQAVLCQRIDNGSSETETVFAAVVSLVGETSLVLERPVEAGEAVAGIVELQGRESDCFVRLDTGAFDLELCSGRAEGLGSSKWGIKHFKGHFDDFELLPSGNNAIGGFYGPFFTPENGLINPPEHTLVEIETVEKGPARTQEQDLLDRLDLCAQGSFLRPSLSRRRLPDRHQWSFGDQQDHRRR